MTKKTKFPFFTVDAAELQHQVENHDNLPITKSTRGIAALTISGVLALGLLISFGFSLYISEFPITPSDILLSLIVYIPLIFFTYKGHLWAIIALGVFYTFDKFYSSILAAEATGGNLNVSTIFFWLLVVGPLWAAFKVERAHRKSLKVVNPNVS